MGHLRGWGDRKTIQLGGRATDHVRRGTSIERKLHRVLVVQSVRYRRLNDAYTKGSRLHILYHMYRVSLHGWTTRVTILIIRFIVILRKLIRAQGPNELIF